MAEEAKEKEAPKSSSEQKKKQKNILVILAVAVLIGAGAYYFINQKSINSINPGGEAQITRNPADSNSASDLTSKKWTWTKTQMSDGTEIAPGAGSEQAFSLTFNPDGTVAATTDCNNGSGSYELGPDNALTFGPMATTMMFCEGSSETDFYQGLNNTGSYKIENGQLWLMLKMDSGTMIFE